MHAIRVYEAVGGPLTTSRDGKHTAGPTTAGTFTLERQARHVSQSWPWSKLAWGTPIKASPSDRDVLYKNHAGHWLSLRALWGLPATFDTLAAVVAEWRSYQTRSGVPDVHADLPPAWYFNDFGHATWYMVNAKGHRNPAFIHTSPFDEYLSAHGKEVKLEHSHGCIHVKPHDIDEMMKAGYLKAGTRVVVHRYTARPHIKLEPAFRGRGRYEIDFFPGVNKLIIMAR